MKSFLLHFFVLVLSCTMANAQTLKKSGPFRCGGWNDDFRQLRDLHWNIEELDLSEAECDSIRQNALHSRHNLKKVILPKKTRIIGSQALFGCINIEAITLPQTVERIESRAFGNCTGLRNIIVLATTPPQLAPDAFSGVDLNQINLIIPNA